MKDNTISHSKCFPSLPKGLVVIFNQVHWHNTVSVYMDFYIRKPANRAVEVKKRRKLNCGCRNTPGLLLRFKHVAMLCAPTQSYCRPLPTLRVCFISALVQCQQLTLELILKSGYRQFPFQLGQKSLEDLSILRNYQGLHEWFLLFYFCR